jgi:hypothetical protein
MRGTLPKEKQLVGAGLCLVRFFVMELRVLFYVAILLFLLSGATFVKADDDALSKKSSRSREPMMALPRNLEIQFCSS